MTAKDTALELLAKTALFGSLEEADRRAVLQ